MIRTIPEHLIFVDISDSPDEPKFKTFCSVDIEFSFRGQDHRLTIPEGFVTDFGSVPKKFRGQISNVSKFNKCWLLHDYMYDKSFEGNFSRSDCDILLRRNLEDFGMGYLDRWIVYYSVKYFGSKRFRKA